MMGQQLAQEFVQGEPNLFLENIPWVESPFFEDLLEKSPYNDSIKQQISFYSTNGYLVLNPEIENFDSIAKDIIHNLSPQQNKYGSRVQDAWRYQDNIKKL